MKKLSLCLILVLVCASAIFAQSTERSTYVAPGGTWIWPLGADESGQPVGEVVLKPGNHVENPVHGNVLWNPSYFLSADEGIPVYAPVDGTVRYMGIGITVPDGKNSMGWSIDEDTDISEWLKEMNPEDLIEELANLKKRHPLFIPENMTKSFAIQMSDGKTLWLTGFFDMSVKEGQTVKRGQQIGRLGYNPTFYKDPSIKLSLSTKAGTSDLELGLYLLGEDNSNHLFFTGRRDISYRPEKILTNEELTEAWNIFKIAILEDHPALIDPLLPQKYKKKCLKLIFC